MIKKILTVLFCGLMLSGIAQDGFANATNIVMKKRIQADVEQYAANKAQNAKNAAESTSGYRLARISADVFLSVTQNHVQDEAIVTIMLDAYSSALETNWAQGIAAYQLKDICSKWHSAENKDTVKSAKLSERVINTAKSAAAHAPRCNAWVQELIEKSTVNGDGGMYINTCTDAGKGLADNAHRVCSTHFTKFGVSLNVALGVLEFYTKQHYHAREPETTVSCSSFWREQNGKDYIACRADIPNQEPVYYEYQLHTVLHDDSREVANNGQYMFCHAVGGKYLLGFCKLDEEACNSLKQPVYDMWMSSGEVRWDKATGYCLFPDIDYSRRSRAINEWAGVIDHTYFADGNQNIETYIFGNDLEANLSAYVAQEFHKRGEIIESFKCARDSKPVVEGALEWIQEDILTCQINGKRVDFIFDDTKQEFKSSSGKKKLSAANEIFSCLGQGGISDGSNCVGLDQTACTNLQKYMKAQGKKGWQDVKYEGGQCVMGSAADLTEQREVIEVVVGAVVVTVGVVLTVATGGAAAPVLTTLANSAVILGGAMSIASDIAIAGVYERFIKTANPCLQRVSNNPETEWKCANDILLDELQKMESYAESLDLNEASALDELFSRMISYLPPEASFWDSFSNPDMWECPSTVVNARGQMGFEQYIASCELVTEAQFWQVMGTIGDWMQIIGGVIKAGTEIAAKFMQTRNTLHMQISKMSTDLLREVSTSGSRSIILPRNMVGKVTEALKGAGQMSDDVARAIATSKTPVKALTQHFMKAGYTYGDDIIINLGTMSGSQILGALAGPGASAFVGAGRQLTPEEQRAFVVAWNNDAGLPAEDFTPITPVVETPDEKAPVKTPAKTPEKTPAKKTPTKTTVVRVSSDMPMPRDPGDEKMDDSFNFGAFADDDIVVEDLKYDIDPYDAKKPMNTGLIATAAVLGAVGTGALIGGLVSNDKDDNKNTKTGTQLEKDLEGLMNNADRSLGFVNGSMIKLVPMATTNNTTAKIVNINGSAVVVVVDYRGHNLPYYVNGQTGSWVPLLGIGQTGGWFNTYLSNTPPSVVTQIQGILGQQLKPSTVVKFVGSNSLGVQFPYAAPDAYKVINAEFPNGVVETFNGVFSPSDQALYNNNYQRILNLFNTAAHLGGFFYCKKLISV